MAHDLDWDQLRIFLAAYRAGSLRGASDKLKVNHATVTRAIQGLETELNTRLFERSVGGLKITQSGEALVGPAEEIERQALSIGRKLTGLDSQPTGKIRVSMPPALSRKFIIPVLASFTEKYPEINVEIIATNAISDLGRSEADVSIRIAHAVEDDVVGRRVVRFVEGTYASPEYLAKHPDLTIGDGSGGHWITWSDKSGWIKKSAFPNAVSRHILSEIPVQIEAAAHHLGLCNVPCFLGDADPRIVRVPDTPITQNLSIWLLLHGDLQKTARIRAFVDHTAEYLQKRRSIFTA